MGIMEILSDPKTLDFFEDEEIKSIVNDREYAYIVYTSNGRNAIIPIKGFSSSNSFNIDTDWISEFISKNIDKDLYFVHTHANSLSSLSNHDMMVLGSFGLKGNCAVGIDGIECHEYNGKTPDVSRINFDKKFIEKISKNKNSFPITFIGEHENEKRKIGVYDEIDCDIQSDYSLKCYGTLWKNSINEYEIGEFDALLVTQNDFFYNPELKRPIYVSTSIDKSFICSGIKTKRGRELICLKD